MPELELIAHVAGIPVEELLPFAYGAGGVWAAMRAYAWRVRRVRSGRSARS